MATTNAPLKPAPMPSLPGLRYPPPPVGTEEYRTGRPAPRPTPGGQFICGCNDGPHAATDYHAGIGPLDAQGDVSDCPFCSWCRTQAVPVDEAGNPIILPEELDTLTLARPAELDTLTL